MTVAGPGAGAGIGVATDVWAAGLSKVDTATGGEACAGVATVATGGVAGGSALGTTFSVRMLLTIVLETPISRAIRRSDHCEQISSARARSTA